MIAGHFGLAAAVKGRATSTPLWALMFATVWLDIIFIPLVLAGVENYARVPGAGAYGGLLIHADYTHSLVGAVILSIVLGSAATLIWSARSGVILGMVSFSHWLLDLIVHRADLPLLPGNALDLPKLGLGLWAFPREAALVELAFVVVGAFIYWRAAKRVLRRSGQAIFPAYATGLMVLSFGVIVLALDICGIGG